MWFLALAACTFVTDAEWAARTPDCEIEGSYLDLDGDGYGNQRARTCEEAAEGIPTAGDCNDGDPAINPGATETYYDNVDANCDGADDNDADLDGYAASAHGGRDCMDGPDDPVPALPGDCVPPSFSPSPAEVHPGATDAVYDGVDLDCSSGSDFDADFDGYSTCQEDCDDTTSTISPNAAETWYDGIDQDCDGNDGDKDEDGYTKDGYTGGLPASALPGDCDDDTENIHPEAADPPYDGVDADCAGNDDNDQDGDGVDGPSGSGPDCDDENAAISPALPERCSTPDDDDCDGAFDAVGAVDCTDWYLDADRDGLGSTPTVCTCQPLGDYDAYTATDCDDDDDAVTIPVWYLDSDGDGAGVPGTTAAACTAPVGYAASSDDCDDADANIYPSAAETCDSVDSDCDGEVNDAEALADCAPWYADDDTDGFGGARSSCLCAAEGDYVLPTSDDCDDADASVSPGATEVCNDGLDNDCDGAPGACSFVGSFSTGDATFFWTGVAAEDAAGSVLLAGGDLDGDGLDELVTTAPGYVAASAEGMIAVLRPDSDAGSALDASTFSIANDDPAVNFGASLASPGDLDLDGHDDLYFGSPDNGSGGWGELRRFTELGSGYVSASTADLVLEGSTSDYAAGQSMAGIDDLDGDGVPELLVGTPDANAGYVRLAPGNLSGAWFLDSAASATLSGESSADRFGASIAVGDADGDGVADAVIGAPGVDYAYGNDGAVYLFSGATAPWSSAADADLMLTVSCPSCRVGATPTALADLDDDGTPDLTFTSPVASYGGAWVVSGSLTGAWVDADGAASTRIPEAGDELGASLGVGDLDDDGLPELVLGAPSSGGSGAVYVFAGPLASGTYTSASASATLQPTSASSFGASLAVLGDADGDGIGELAIGASTDGTAGANAGAAYLFVGGGY